ncbi:MAG TPA: hypothetical protein VHE13_10185 [Opitutus sp.]|nr:hypothetical protein [Opitutus sp.]
MLSRALAVASVSVLVAGCQTHSSSSSPSGARELTYRAADEKQIRQRAEQFEQSGYSKADAVRRARAEAASQSWSYDNTNAWADEKRREDRSAAREQMDKDLAKLDRP